MFICILLFANGIYVNMYIFRHLTQPKYEEKKYCYMIESLVCPWKMSKHNFPKNLFKDNFMLQGISVNHKSTRASSVIFVHTKQLLLLQNILYLVFNKFIDWETSKMYNMTRIKCKLLFCINFLQNILVAISILKILRKIEKIFTV